MYELLKKTDCELRGWRTVKIWMTVMMVWLALSVTGKVIVLLKQEKVRELKFVAWDTVLEVALLVWAAWVFS